MPITYPTYPTGASLHELIEAIADEARTRHTVPRAVVDDVLDRLAPSVAAYDELVREGAVSLVSQHALRRGGHLLR